ncbi:archease [Pseudogulbenkiania sp. MAI-1]|uniref:archease n=1 Tax=Pseudogulbenkiania sp. MAI-1 TaxID=990370 RepID=UPI00045E5D02|nr:archease [Pseudogulbenkiania sp. MAI-1]
MAGEEVVPAAERVPRFGYFDHDADLGIEARGPTPEAAMEAAAEAMFGVMTELASLRPEQVVTFEFDEADPELALVTWLNRLLAEAQSRRLALCRFRLHHDGSHWRGEAWGQPWTDGMERGVEVKGATLTQLSLTPQDGGWQARCVVDV